MRNCVEHLFNARPLSRMRASMAMDVVSQLRRLVAPRRLVRRTAVKQTAMLSRREMLALTSFAAAAIRRSGEAAPLASASQPSTRVNFAVPAGACDCHTHVFGDPRRFPFAEGRTYTPEPASIDEMRALHRALHTTRVVIVQPSVYGTDNGCTLDAIRQLAP